MLAIKIKKILKSILSCMPSALSYCHRITRRVRIHMMQNRKKLSWEDKIKLVERKYLENHGKVLDWNNLRKYTEKMQWYKMYDADERKSVLADKYAVREWVTEKMGGGEHLIPLLGVWDSFDEIDFDMLPEKFVLKSNNGSGTNLLVKNKSELNLKKTRRLVNSWLKMEFAYFNPFEFQYAAIPPKIIAEEFMETDTGDLPDYKFLCFDGKPHFCWVDMDRYSNHTRNIYDMDWKLQSWGQKFGNYDGDIPCPENFEEMKRIATLLSEGFSHVRVDLYDIKGKIYFGEMTFTSAGGFEKIYPDEADLMLGDLWNVDTLKRDNRYKV